METAQFTIVKGRYFIQVDNFGEDKTAVPAMAALARSILGQVAGEPADPALLSLLPKEKLIAGSERLVRGPVAFQPYFTFGEGDIFRQGGRIFGAVGEYLDDAGRWGGSSSGILLRRRPRLGPRNAVGPESPGLTPTLRSSSRGRRGFVFQDFKGGLAASGLRERGSKPSST